MDNNVFDIESLITDYKKSELKEYSKQQYLALQQATKKITELQEEIKHLQILLVSTTTLIQDNVEKIIVSPEEALIEHQINLLETQYRGTDKHLTLEDVKKLDLLIKNKKILQEQNKIIQGKSKPVVNAISYDELVKLAAENPDGQ